MQELPSCINLVQLSASRLFSSGFSSITVKAQSNGDTKDAAKHRHISEKDMYTYTKSQVAKSVILTHLLSSMIGVEYFV